MAVRKGAGPTTNTFRTTLQRSRSEKGISGRARDRWDTYS